MGAMPAPRVLIIDDDPHVAAAVARTASRAGADVDRATTGVGALNRCAETRYDLIITDVHMPVKSAWILVPEIRALPGYTTTPIIVVTSDPSRTTRITLLEAGADDFLLKPLDPVELELRLHKHLKHGAIAADLTTVTGERDRALADLAQRNAELERLTVGLVASLERANQLNDDDTGNHINRVCAYAELLATAAGHSCEVSEQLRRYAGLHDVGKVGIRDAILKKPGRLSPAEFEEMKSHTVIGHELLRCAGLPVMACNIALHHHERWDGRGYPRGLAGELIPSEARVVSIVDVFDALVSKRVYKPAFATDVAYMMLTEAAGSQLDPGLVEVFLTLKQPVAEIRARYPSPSAEMASWG